jgi:putative transposase
MQIEPKSVTPRSFGVHDRIGIGIGTANPIYYRCISSDAAGHVFQRVDQPDVTESFTHEDIARLELTPGYRYDRDWFHPGHAKARLMSSVDRFALIPDAEKPGVIFRHDWCIRFLEKEAAGEASRADKSMAAIIKTIAAEIAAAQAVKTANSRAGSTSVVKAPPCVRTLRQWVVDLQAGGMNPSALRNGYRHCGHDAPQRDPDLEMLMRKHAARYASETRATKAGLYKDLLVDVGELNKARAAAGFPLVKPPSSKVFAVRIDDLTTYEVTAGRQGLAAARKKFLVVSGGLDVKRPGERIEIDEWRVPLQTLLIKAGIWETLTPDLQELVVRERWWLTVAIDCASRCILGMRLAPSANSASAILVLAMICADKSRFGAAVGALTPWDMACGLELVATDMGSGYIADNFRNAVLNAGGTPFTAPAGLAEMRARVERVFGSLHTQLISRFTGRSFHNTAELGEYPSEARASLTLDELAWVVVRFVVDAYHNLPHEGLGGETPRDAWRRLTKLYGAVPAPDPDTRRNAFGVKLTRTLTNRGVRFLNLYYQSLDLQEYRRKVGDVEVEIMIDLADLGWASVKIGDAGWLTVPCLQPMQHVHADDWIAACEELRRHFGDQAAIAEPIVLKAIADIQAIGDGAVRRAHIGSTMLTAEELNRAERLLPITWSPPAGSPAAERDPNDPAGLFDGEIKPSSDAAPPADTSPSTPAPPTPKPKWTMED